MLNPVHSTPMSVIPVTVFCSLGLVFVFVALFWREHRRHHFASPERDSLLPLAEETPRLVTPAARPAPPAAPAPGSPSP
jgi:hypothetical protein